MATDERHYRFDAGPGQQINVINDSSKAVTVLLDYGPLGTARFDAPIGSKVTVEVGINGAPDIYTSDWNPPELPEDVVPINQQD